MTWPSSARRIDGASASRREGAFVLLVAAVGAAVAVVNAFSTMDERRSVGRPVAFWEPMVWEASSAIVLVALAPAVMAFTRRSLPPASRWAKVAALHVVAAVAFSGVHVAAMGALRWAAYALVGGEYAPLSPLAAFPYELRKDLLTSATLVAVYAAWLRLRAERSTPAPPAIEVRDGARRYFVPLAEIAWIEAAGNYVELYRGRTPILHRIPLSQLARELEGAGFVRIHRSRLVRRDAIVELHSKASGDYVVRLADGSELAGSRRYRRPLL